MFNENAVMSLGDALSIWVELTKTEPGRKEAYNLSSMAISAIHKEIQEALNLDPSELTGKMIFSYVVQNYFEERAFTVDEILNEPKKVSDYLDKARKLANYLRSDLVVSESNSFAEKVIKSLEHYGATSRELLDLVTQTGPHGDRAALAILRRDSLKSFSRLQINQFLDGEVDSANCRPVYGKFLHRWNNINSMLKAAVAAPSGVTVNMIRSSTNPYGVYFVFAIRNGGRLFTFTDKEWTPHPLAESMWHRPDKILAARAGRNWFPYDLAGLKFDDEGKPYIDTSSGKSIVQYQNKSEPIKQLIDLNPAQVIWLTMMLDLIVDKFWNHEHQEPELSYTGEMIKVASPLLDAAQTANLPLSLRSDTTISLEPLILADVHSSNVSSDDVGKKLENPNAWLEERYRDQVLVESLNLVSPPESKKFVSFFPVDNLNRRSMQTNKEIAIAPYIMEEEDVASAFPSTFDRRDALSNMATINSLDATSFGTKDQLQKDRIFLARSNYASQINLLANLEFDKRKHEIEKWVKEKIVENLDNLLSIFGKNKIIVKTALDSSRFGDRGVSGVCYNSELMTREFTSHIDLNDKSDSSSYFGSYGRHPIVLGTLTPGNSKYRCYFTGSAASYFLQIIPETNVQLAYLCGINVNDLPDVLQHWTKIKRYTGNPILNRIDPILWNLDNPWSSMDFKVGLYVSKRSYNEIHKLALEKPWSEPNNWHSHV